MNCFYDAALKIAKRKLAGSDGPSKLNSPRLGTGGSFVNIFLWDTAFCCHWAKYHSEEFPVAESLDNFYLTQYDDGFISRETMPDGISRWEEHHPISFAPPLLGWAELELHRRGFRPERLAQVFPKLLRQHQYNMMQYQRPDGLFFSDCFGCGMDDMPRWDDRSEVTADGGIPLTRASILEPGKMGDDTYAWLRSISEHHCFDWNRQLGWCDTSCQMAFNALTLSRIAELLGQNENAAQLRAEHRRIADAVNDLCWDDRAGFYFDRLGDHTLHRRHIGAYWALLAEVAPKERAQQLFDALCDPADFNRPCGIPCLSASDPEYMQGYWRGPVWAPATYMVLCGLRSYGEMELARRIARKTYDSAERIFQLTHTVWENYSPEQCQTPSPGVGSDFCGWSALFPITLPREFL